MRIKVNDQVSFPNLVRYNVSFMGIDVTKQPEKKLLLAITDVSGNFVIEKLELLVNT